MINEIHKETGYSLEDVSDILNALRRIVKRIFSDSDESVEIKLFHGLKIFSKYVSVKDSKLNLCNNGFVKSDYLLYLGSEFSNRFKEEIKKKHNDISS